VIGQAFSARLFGNAHNWLQQSQAAKDKHSVNGKWRCALLPHSQAVHEFTNGAKKREMSRQYSITSFKMACTWFSYSSLFLNYSQKVKKTESALLTGKIGVLVQNCSVPTYSV
jgi:hypothetical protein